MMKQCYKRLVLIVLSLITIILSVSCNLKSADNKFDIPSGVVGVGADGDSTKRLPDYKVENKTIKMLTHTDAPPLSSLEEVYGAKVVREIVPVDQRVSRLQQLVNSGDSPDLFEYDFSPSLVQKGYIQPANKYIDFNTPLWKDVMDSHVLSTYNGNIYNVDPICGRYTVLWYNKDIFNEAGEKLPSELLKEGNWNWDTYREIAKRLTVSGSDGTVQQWGTAIDEMDLFVHSTGKYFITIENGKAINNIKSEQVTRAMNFYIDLTTKDKCNFVDGDAKQTFRDGKIAMILGGLWFRDPFQDMLRAGTIAFVPVPKDPKADKFYIQESFGGYSIPKGAKNPVGAAAFLCCFRYERQDKAKIQEDYDNLAKAFGWNRENQDMLDQMQGEKYASSPVTSYIFGLQSLFGDMFVRPREGEPWATIAEEVSPKIDEVIAQAYSK